MITLNGHKLEPTVFPDGTSQVWKLPKWLIGKSQYFIDWRWEAKESEIIQIIQLVWLLRTEKLTKINLYVPYLPYARQDKLENPNDSCFALSPFFTLLNYQHFNSITIYDVHNESRLPSNLYQNIEPVEFHKYVMDHVKPELLVFPDVGAAKRYPHLHDYSHAIFAKKRDQSSGQITGMECIFGEGLIDKVDCQNVLVIDDICDGGATFLHVAEAIKKINPKIDEDYTYLAVSHGIFSKGTGKLNDTFKDIYTTDSLCKAQFLLTDPFKV